MRFSCQPDLDSPPFIPIAPYNTTVIDRKTLLVSHGQAVVVSNPYQRAPLFYRQARSIIPFLTGRFHGFDDSLVGRHGGLVVVGKGAAMFPRLRRQHEPFLAQDIGRQVYFRRGFAIRRQQLIQGERIKFGASHEKKVAHRDAPGATERRRVRLNPCIKVAFPVKLWRSERTRDRGVADAQATPSQPATNLPQSHPPGSLVDKGENVSNESALSSTRAVGSVAQEINANFTSIRSAHASYCIRWYKWCKKNYGLFYPLFQQFIEQNNAIIWFIAGSLSIVSKYAI